jgi:transcriptional regulator with XRE-family HTH domain
MKLLRLERKWSQEELAQLSDLNVRTIQRVEKGENVGIETLRSLASVFEISTDELLDEIARGKQAQLKENEVTSTAQSQQREAQERVKSIKYFYVLSAFLLGIFLLLMLPNYNGGENLGPLIVIFLSFCAIIAGYACAVFQPFGEKWEKEKISQILSQQSENSRSNSEQ